MSGSENGKMAALNVLTLLNDTSGTYCRIKEIQGDLIHYESYTHTITKKDGVFFSVQEKRIKNKELFQKCLIFLTEEEGINLDEEGMFPSTIPMVSRAIWYYARHYN